MRCFLSYFCVVNLFFRFGGEGLALVEAVHPSGGAYDFFIARVERGARAADFNFYFRNSGAYQKNRPAGAGGFGLRIVLWMDIFFHPVRDRKSLDFLIFMKIKPAKLTD